MKWTKIEDFHSISVELVGMADIVRKNAEEAEHTLKTRPVWEHNRRNNTYNSTWDTEFYRDEHEPVAIVRNRNNWQLTWLLENGHLIVNKKGGVGYAHGVNHIHKTFDEQKETFIDDMKDIGIKVNIK